MRKIFSCFYLSRSIIIAGVVAGVNSMQGNVEENVKLPHPSIVGSIPVEKSINERRSVRLFKEEPLSLKELSQLLWAAQGITDKARGLRAAPSAGALYPLEIYVVVGNVEGLSAGVYKYVIGKHELTEIKEGDERQALSAAALSQSCVTEAPASIVICAVYRT